VVEYYLPPFDVDACLLVLACSSHRAYLERPSPMYKSMHACMHARMHVPFSSPGDVLDGVVREGEALVEERGFEVRPGQHPA
jgi:hypothetical protein